LKNRTNPIIGITVGLSTVVSFDGIDFWPVELSFAINTGLIVINSFAAFFLCVIQYFAVDAEFTVSCCIGGVRVKQRI
jgi:hypothetical protein